MKRPKFRDEQIIGVLREQEADARTAARAKLKRNHGQEDRLGNPLFFHVGGSAA